MKRTGILLWIVHLVYFLAGQERAPGFLPETHPVFQLNFVHPTADKPQSKLWFMEGSWWALLPDSTGPTLWQHTEKGWRHECCER